MEARRFPRDAVATAHYLASASGLAVLADGGNAVDAAIAANLTLGVVTPYACGYGGGLFAGVWGGGPPRPLRAGRSPGGGAPRAAPARARPPPQPGVGPPPRPAPPPGGGRWRPPPPR